MYEEIKEGERNQLRQQPAQLLFEQFNEPPKEDKKKKSKKKRAAPEPMLDAPQNFSDPIRQAEQLNQFKLEIEEESNRSPAW